MGKYVQWTTYKGKRMLYLNAKGLREAEYMAAMEEMKQELLKERDGTLVLVDATKTEMTTLTTNKAKEVAAATKAKGIPDRPSVVVGLTGLQRAVAQLFGRGIHFSSTIEEAKEWLVKEDNKNR
jgi:methanogenic corrinoid protein MtbC1